jgi:predicted nucleic acid-binding protein
VIAVDANVILGLHLPGEDTSAAMSLLHTDPDWIVPVLWRSEFRNALAKYVRRGGLALDEALRIQAEAEGLMRGGEYDVDSDTVLRLAEISGCSAYDCEYVALAKRLGCRLATRDKQVLRGFPEIATAL